MAKKVLVVYDEKLIVKGIRFSLCYLTVCILYPCGCIRRAKKPASPPVFLHVFCLCPAVFSISCCVLPSASHLTRKGPLCTHNYVSIVSKKP